uniref:Uncharacterized protein n=1 Tax=Vespula pensylvanica TaxID=30213 RepID=A0A834JQK3_VESPE|nr:hypothetical protein H0235_017289 [Vespula pensylvanica]
MGAKDGTSDCERVKSSHFLKEYHLTLTETVIHNAFVMLLGSKSLTTLTVVQNLILLHLQNSYFLKMMFWWIKKPETTARLKLKLELLGVIFKMLEMLEREATGGIILEAALCRTKLQCEKPRYYCNNHWPSRYPNEHITKILSCCAIPCHTVLCYAVLCRTVPYCAVPHRVCGDRPEIQYVLGHCKDNARLGIERDNWTRCGGARVKSGVKILDASSSSPDWIVDVDINAKNTAATFTARRKENASRMPSA